MKRFAWSLLALGVVACGVFLFGGFDCLAATGTSGAAVPGDPTKAYITLGILVVAALLFVTEALPLPITAMLVPVALSSTGVLTSKVAFSYFGDNTVVLFMAMFIIGESTFVTGFADKVGETALKLSKGDMKKLLLFSMIAVGGLSTVLSNTGTTAVAVPMIMGMCASAKVAPSKILMPVAFASSLGGTVTLVGTPPNGIVNSMLDQVGLQPFGFFEFGKFGLILFAIAFAVSMVRGKRWQRVGARSALSLMGLGCFTCCTSILYCYAMSVLPVSVALTLLFQFTWIGTVLQIILTRKPPALSQVIAAAVVIVGTVFASGVYKTGIAGYDPLGLVCGFGAAISCACFVTFSGRVKAPCSNEQRGMIVCAGVVIASHLVCPDFIVSGVLLDGFAPYAFVCGLFGMTLPVLLFGLGTPHLTPGMSTIMTSAELPAGLLLAMLALGEPISAVEWLGVAIILAGVCIAQVRLGKRPETTPLPTD